MGSLILRETQTESLSVIETCPLCLSPDLKLCLENKQHSIFLIVHHKEEDIHFVSDFFFQETKKIS